MTRPPPAPIAAFAPVLPLRVFPVQPPPFRLHPASRPLSSSPLPPQRRRALVAALKPASVGVAGAGIAGLTAAIALLRTPGTGVTGVTLFDARPMGEGGGGAALNINGGAAILARSYGLDLWPCARPMAHVSGFAAGGARLFHVDVDKEVRKSKATRDALMVEGRSMFMTVMRADLLRLLDEEARGRGVEVRRGEGNRVVDVREREGGAGFVLADGSETQRFDLVLGADGVKSEVRAHVVGESMKRPEYTGIRVAWAIAPPGGCALPDGHLQQWFGDGGYALWYAAGPADNLTEMVVFSAREKERTQENAAYKSEDGIREDLRERLEACGMPVQVMEAFGRGTRFIETSVYQHGGITNWSKGGVCALVGDAAHAMPPFLGQGANQAIQDAHALAIAVSSIGEECDNLSAALTKYERMRKSYAEAILQTSKIVGLLETQGGAVGSAARNTLFRAMGLAGVQAQALIQSAKPSVM